MIPESIEKAAEQAEGLSRMTAAAWQQLGISFVLGSFTSAWWTLREGKRKPKPGEILSSMMISGLGAVAVVALLLDYHISFGKLVFVSIMCGFSGDVIIRVLARGFVSVVRRAFNMEEPDASEEGKGDKGKS